MAFVLERHLGHQTYADNLQAASTDHPELEPCWIGVTYEPTGGVLERVPLPRAARSVVRARRQIAAGLGRCHAEVHVFNTQVPAVIGPRAARRAPYVLITDVTPLQYDAMAAGYGHRADRPGPLGRAKHAWNVRVFGGARWCVGWSSWARTSMVDDYGVDPERAVVIPPGVDTELWRPSEPDPGRPVRLLFVGGDLDRKGGRLVLDAFAALPPGAAELVLVTRSEVAAQPGVRAIDDLVPNDPRLVELYRSSDVFVLPSLSETFGIAAVEATAAGLPVVASAVGGLVDIVSDGETGFTIRPGDAAALADRLRRLVGDPDLRRRLGAAGRARALERFDARANAARLFDLVGRAGRP